MTATEPNLMSKYFHINANQSRHKLINIKIPIVISFEWGFKIQLQQDPCDITDIPVRICRLKSHRVMEVSEKTQHLSNGQSMPLLRKYQSVKLELVKPIWVLHSTFCPFLAAQLQFLPHKIKSRR